MFKLIATLFLIESTGIGQTALTTAQIARKVSPTVVVIQGKTDSGEVLGSGFILSTDGKLVTNFHVIRDMNSASVQLANGKLLGSVAVLATDEAHDLAILQLPASDLPALELGNSDTLSVGEPLVIVGSPNGLEGTVTAGILSSVRDLGDGFKLLQTDAAVNPGNSGGPVLNSKGQAIGVVSFQLRSTQGLNFAIPINYVRELLNNLHKPISFTQVRKSLIPKGPSGGKVGSSDSVSIAGVELRLGMGKDTALAKFVGAPDLKLFEVQTDFYTVMKRKDQWQIEGSLIFHSGKLTRIEVDAYSSNDEHASTLARALYAAVASAGPEGPIDVWATTKATGSSKRSSPIYEVHLLFKDREVVIGTGSFSDGSTTVEVPSVQTYFPRVLRSDR